MHVFRRKHGRMQWQLREKGERIRNKFPTTPAETAASRGSSESKVRALMAQLGAMAMAFVLWD